MPSRKAEVLERNGGVELLCTSSATYIVLRFDPAEDGRHDAMPLPNPYPALHRAFPAATEKFPANNARRPVDRARSYTRTVWAGASIGAVSGREESTKSGVGTPSGVASATVTTSIRGS